VRQLVWQSGLADRPRIVRDNHCYDHDSDYEFICNATSVT